MSCIHLATALVRRGDRILLVASRYPNHPEPLWNMPGGRQQPGELLAQTALRELAEETGLRGEIERLCYVSESYDGDVHFTNATFAVRAEGELRSETIANDHVVECGWFPVAEIERRLEVRVVREPLLAYLNGESAGYAGYPEAGVTIEFPD
ncbi:MAG TPA: NUDIX domain-containing protein [Candidatus Baltobacteraceae bacterium]|nr:NUDIX domain-containing protein [Candidatus Baltobacteraceae bacterium]